LVRHAPALSQLVVIPAKAGIPLLPFLRAITSLFSAPEDAKNAKKRKQEKAGFPLSRE